MQLGIEMQERASEHEYWADVREQAYADSNWNDDEFWLEAAQLEIEDRDRSWFDSDWWDDSGWLDDDWPEEPTMQELQDDDDWYVEMREDQCFDIDIGNVPWSKIKGFIEDAKGWKSYDTKNGGRNKREPTRKKFAHWHGYKVQHNHVKRTIASMVKPCEMVWKIEKKLKSNPKYKHNRTYKTVVDREIHDRLRTQPDWWWNHSPITRKLDKFDGCIWLISEMDKYGIPRSNEE